MSQATTTILALGRFGLGGLLRELGRFPESEAEYRTALGLWKQLTTEFHDVPAYRRYQSTGHMGLGNTLRAAGKKADAEVEYRKAVVVLKALVGDFPAVVDYRRELTGCHMNLGVALAEMNKRPEAEVEYRIALQYGKQLAADFPGRPDFRQALARNHNNLANLLRLERKPDDAAAEYLRAIELAKQLVADAQELPQSAIELGSYCNNYGFALTEAGRPADALDWHRQGIDSLTPIVQRDPRLAAAKQYLRNGHRSRAAALAKLDRHAEAIVDWDRAIELEDGSNRAAYRFRRASSLARVEPTRAVAEIEDLVKGPGLTPLNVYNAACALSVASSNLSDSVEKDRVGRGAVNFLRQIQAKGYFKTKANAERLKTDADLDAVRSRDDFKQLMTEAAAN